MKFYLEIESNNIDTIIKNLKIDVLRKDKNILFNKYYKIVSSEKEKIDKLENNENWDKMKKIGNPYELIYTTYNKKRKNDSISQHIPISRSYFKMWEIFYNFDLFKNFNMHNEHIFAHLAEGPGGFMEATYNFKSKINKKKSINDTFYGITLKPTNEYIPDFNKIKKIFNGNNNIKIEYGNLYIYDDVKNYISKFNNQKAILVTADGGFDYSSNFNGQEINSCQIIYSECIVALNILKKGGSFVCKVFDLFSYTMIQILYIVSSCFEEVYIYKPETSRPANSEKYLVCMYYKNNLSSESKDNLLKIIELWNNKTSDLTEDDSIIFKDIKVSNSFIQNLNNYNEQYMETQIYYLNNTIKLAEHKIEKDKYYEIIQNQVNNAIEWCKKYDMEINKNSIYYKKNLN
jgi:cap1 methyltransferase